MKTPVTISLSKLRIYAHHGVLPQERTVGNWFEVSISITVPCQAVKSDNIEHTVSYAVIADIIRRQMAVPSNLIEHVAGRISEAIRNEFPEITHESITITKLTPPIDGIICSGASVTLEF